MSRMIPQRSINAFRKFVDVSLINYGIDCTLYVPSNINTVENLDLYIQPSDYTYTSYTTKVFIEWSANKHKLRKMGIFVEDESPMVAWFPNVIVDRFGNETDLDIGINSYFQISMQYVPGSISDTDQFDIVDVLIPNAHDAVLTKAFKIASRRVKTS